jgi:hypothetical protein
MFNQGEAPKEPFQDLRTGLNWIAFISRTGAVTVEVFLHSRFGERYIAMEAVAALVLIPVFGLFWPDSDVLPLMQFMGVYLFMCLMARIGVTARRLRGNGEHSRYTGYPHLVRMFGLPEVAVKRFVEPIVVAFAGAVANPLNEPLGGYLMFAAVCLFISTNLDDMWTRTRAIDVHDAVIEQQMAARRFREMANNRW